MCVKHTFYVDATLVCSWNLLELTLNRHPIHKTSSKNKTNKVFLYIYLPQEDSQKYQQQDQGNDCKEDYPPGYFGEVLNLFLQKHCEFYLWTVRWVWVWVSYKDTDFCLRVVGLQIYFLLVSEM